MQRTRYNGLLCKAWKEEGTVCCRLYVWSMQRTGYSVLQAVFVEHAENRVQWAAYSVCKACKEEGTVGCRLYLWSMQRTGYMWAAYSVCKACKEEGTVGCRLRK